MFMLSHTARDKARKSTSLHFFSICILLTLQIKDDFSLHVAVQTLFMLNVCPSCKNIFVAQVKVDYTLLHLETCFVAWCML